METRNESVSDYSQIGLLANPFVAPSDQPTGPLGVRLAIANAGYGLLASLNASMDTPEHRPVQVNKGTEVPVFYPVTSLAQVLGALSAGAPVPGVLQVYVPLDMMRLGRVRAGLSVLAERVAGNRPEVTIGEWTRRALAEPDDQLAEWETLCAVADCAALAEESAADPVEFAVRVFGTPEASRAGAEDLEVLMRVSTARQGVLEDDPDEGDNGEGPDETADEHPLGDAFVTPLGMVPERVLDEHSIESVDHEIAEYVLSYLAANISTVVARGVRAYQAQGTSSMAEELKVTKAPLKTMAALARFARGQWRGIALIFDRFEIFEDAPSDLRTKIASTLMQLRWALKDEAVVVLVMPQGIAPEVEESFASAARVDWSYSSVGAFEAMDAPFDATIATEWLAAASLESVPAWAESVIAAVPAGASAERAFAVLGAELDAAAAETRDPSAEAVRAGLTE